MRSARASPQRLQPGDVVALSGGLGAGKTTLARAVIGALGHQGEVPSPTFTILETYDPPAVRLPLVHADFYRLDRPQEAEELGLDDYREGAALIAEWPEHAGGFAHEPGCLAIALEICGWRAQGDCRTGRRLARAPAMSSTGRPPGWTSFSEARLGRGGGRAAARRCELPPLLPRPQGRASAMLMDAPPPHEDPGPFLHVGKWLTRARLARAGDLRRAARAGPGADRGFRRTTGCATGSTTIREAEDDDLRARDRRAGRASRVGRRGRSRLTTWRSTSAKRGCLPNGTARRCSSRSMRAGYARGVGRACSRRCCRARIPASPCCATTMPRTSCCWPGGEQGLIDFQDALVGHPAYDLVSLLQDARRDVSPGARAQRCSTATWRKSMQGADFEADYARLGAQRNAKIVGIFARLWLRDGKPRYLRDDPAGVGKRWSATSAHPALAPVAEWFAANIPAGAARYAAAARCGRLRSRARCPTPRW